MIYVSLLTSFLLFVPPFLCPAIQQSGHLDVVVPPDILNAPELSADESVTNEGGNVQLMCQATGVPEPRQVLCTITWCLRPSSSAKEINDSFSFSLPTPQPPATSTACSGDVKMEKTSSFATKAETSNVMNLII